MRSIEKKRNITFAEVDIRHRMAPLRMLYSVTLAFIFQDQTFSCYAFAIKNAQAADDLHGTRRGVALVITFYLVMQ